MHIELNSKPFGKIKISPDQMITFPQGILGFENYYKYAFIEDKEDNPFKWLQSVDEPDLAFIVMQPELFASKYNPVISRAELKEIGLEKIEESIVLVIVTIPNNKPEEMTANLQGPILINKKNLTARQYISRDENHPVRVRIADYLEKAGNSDC